MQEAGTKSLLKDAVALYKTPNPAARQDSVEKIWDALERLKTYYTTLDKKHSSEKIVNDMMLEGTTGAKENYQRFNLSNDGLIIYFERYQIAPYYYGDYSITIPYQYLELTI